MEKIVTDSVNLSSNFGKVDGRHVQATVVKACSLWAKNYSVYFCYFHIKFFSDVVVLSMDF